MTSPSPTNNTSGFRTSYLVSPAVKTYYEVLEKIYTPNYILLINNHKLIATCFSTFLFIETN